MEKIKQAIEKFRDDRNWKSHHMPKDLAISISLEANELLENFQWKTNEEALELHKKEIEEELADVMIYAIQLASALDLNIETIILDKMKKNAIKYPVK